MLEEHFVSIHCVGGVYFVYSLLPISQSKSWGNENNRTSLYAPSEVSIHLTFYTIYSYCLKNQITFVFHILQ